MRRLIALVLGLTTWSCTHGTTVDPLVRAQLDSLFTLRPGQEATIEGTSLRLRFVSVPEDSRCPVDVDCVWAGDAQVHLLLRGSDSAEQTLDLHTSLEPRFAVVNGLRLTLHRLEPVPRSEARIPQEEYEVELLVSREP